MADRDHILRALSASETGLTVAELVGLVGTSDSQVRRGLLGLVAAGTVATFKDVPEGPGRPSLRFRVAPRDASWPGLVRALLTAIWDEESAPIAARERVAKACGVTMATGQPRDALFDLMAGLGFAPRDETTPADVRELCIRVRFQACPFSNVTAREAADTVCLMHRGLLDGTVAQLGGSVDSFDMYDPCLAGCELRARMPPGL